MSTSTQTTPEPGVITFLTMARATHQMVLIVSVVYEVEETTYALIILVAIRLYNTRSLRYSRIGRTCSSCNSLHFVVLCR